MAENEEKKRTLWGQAMENTLHFAFNLAFVFIFQPIFGVQSVLPGVVISVGMIMFPDGHIGTRPVTMVGITIGLYCGCVIVGRTALMLPAAALVIDFLLVFLIMALTYEPIMYKPATSFLLCFVFAQSTPVPPAAFPMRLAGAAAGAAAVAATTVIKWHWQGHRKEGRGLKEQIRLCTIRKDYILRMSMGITTAMFIGMVLRLRKPLQIGIVVMPLTQLHYHETLKCVRHRFLRNTLDILFFVVVFRMLVPESWAFGTVSLLGYINFFTSEYKYKRIVNAVSAINASLVLLDTSTAIENRLLCLADGACIVLVLYLAQELGRGIMNHTGTAAACRIRWCGNYRYDSMEFYKRIWYNGEKRYNIIQRANERPALRGCEGIYTQITIFGCEDKDF